jgi:hypothetical protein
MATSFQNDITPKSVKIPANYPSGPAPGKISLLFEANKSNIYHKFNAREFDNGNILFGSNQPYVYRYPDETPSKLRQLGGRGLPLGMGADDVVRIGKFMASGRGVLFIGKQFMLQGFQPFDETSLYNPTEVLLSATTNILGGVLEKPKRHIDKSGGLLGGLAALVGIGVSRGTPPSSTVAGSVGEESVLPTQNYGNGAGMLRGKTANKARSILQSKLGSSSGGSGIGGPMSFLKGMARSMFPQVFGSEKQSGVKQRADEIAYDLMVKYYNDVTAKGLASGMKNTGLSISFMGIGLKSLSASKTSVKISNSNTKSFEQKYSKDAGGTTKIYGETVYLGENKKQKGTIANRGGDFFALVGKNVEESSEIKDAYEANGVAIKSNIEDVQKQSGKYVESANNNSSVIDKAFEKYKQSGKQVTSRELVQDSTFIKTYDEKSFDNSVSKKANDRSVNLNTKLNIADTADKPASQINENLKRVLDKINSSGIYKTEFENKDTWVFSSGNPSKQGYDRLHDMAKTPFNMKNNANSVESAYYNAGIRTVDANINPSKNYGFAGAGRPDKINTLTVLDKNRQVKDSLISNYTEWNPYDDDIVAFFFYDIVNEKYIPFRSTVKGLSESNNALWEELRFMGRADSLYSYTGFTRNLSFSFTVNINSLIELYPTWQRINYLAGAVKPSNYTKRSHSDGSTNRFIIPPMFMLTIGDLYKYQPVVITTVSVTVPDDSSWETTAENSVNDWSFLAKIIKTTVPKGKIGQVPLTAEISVACNILEKERPQVGGNHYGHAIRPQLFVESDVEHMQYPSDFSKNIRGVKLANMDD